MAAFSKRKLATHTSSWSKSATPEPHSSTLRIPEASQSNSRSLKLNSSKTSLTDQVYSKQWSHRLKPEDVRNSAAALTSPRIEIPIAQATATELRRHFLRNLDNLTGPPVRLINDIDDSSPPVSFTFVNSSIISEGVETVDEGFMSGCDCRDENGRNCGCEYRTCSCLQHSAKDERGKHHFPYSAGKNQGILRTFYLNSRHHIYECNKNCNCRDNCKNKVVQHGRQVTLEIFKTKDRGWGNCGFTVAITNADDLQDCVVLRIFRKGNSSTPIVERSLPMMRLSDERKLAPRKTNTLWTLTSTPRIAWWRQKNLKLYFPRMFMSKSSARFRKDSTRLRRSRMMMTKRSSIGSILCTDPLTYVMDWTTVVRQSSWIILANPTVGFSQRHTITRTRMSMILPSLPRKLSRLGPNLPLTTRMRKIEKSSLTKWLMRLKPRMDIGLCAAFVQLRVAEGISWIRMRSGLKRDVSLVLLENLDRAMQKLMPLARSISTLSDVRLENFRITWRAFFPSFSRHLLVRNFVSRKISVLARYNSPTRMVLPASHNVLNGGKSWLAFSLRE